MLCFGCELSSLYYNNWFCESWTKNGRDQCLQFSNSPPDSLRRFWICLKTKATKLDVDNEVWHWSSFSENFFSIFLQPRRTFLSFQYLDLRTVTLSPANCDIRIQHRVFSQSLFCANFLLALFCEMSVQFMKNDIRTFATPCDRFGGSPHFSSKNNHRRRPLNTSPKFGNNQTCFANAVEYCIFGICL